MLAPGLLAYYEAADAADADRPRRAAPLEAVSRVRALGAADGAGGGAGAPEFRFAVHFARHNARGDAGEPDAEVWEFAADDDATRQRWVRRLKHALHGL